MTVALVGRQHDKAREILKEKEPVLHALVKPCTKKKPSRGRNL